MSRHLGTVPIRGPSIDPAEYRPFVNALDARHALIDAAQRRRRGTAYEIVLTDLESALRRARLRAENSAARREHQQERKSVRLAPTASSRVGVALFDPTAR